MPDRHSLKSKSPSISSVGGKRRPREGQRYRREIGNKLGTLLLCTAPRCPISGWVKPVSSFAKTIRRYSSSPFSYIYTHVSPPPPPSSSHLLLFFFNPQPTIAFLVTDHSDLPPFLNLPVPTILLYLHEFHTNQETIKDIVNLKRYKVDACRQITITYNENNRIQFVHRRFILFPIFHYFYSMSVNNYYQ